MSYKPKILGVADGGSGASNFTQNGGIVAFDGTKLVNYTGARLDSSGRMTNSSQPCFQAYLSVSATNLTGDGTVVAAPYDSVSFDTTSSYNTSTYTFTAPVTGRYLFVHCCTFSGLTTSVRSIRAKITTSTQQFWSFLGYNPVVTDVSQASQTVVAIAQLNAGQTAIPALVASGTTKTIGVYSMGSSNPFSYFSGYLIC